MSKVTFKQYLGNGTMHTYCDADSNFDTGVLVEIQSDNDIAALTDAALTNVYITAEKIETGDPALCVLYPVTEKDTLVGFLETAKMAGETISTIGKGAASVDNNFKIDNSELGIAITNEGFYITDIDSTVYTVTPVAGDAKTYISATVLQGDATIAADTSFKITSGKPVADAAGAYKTAFEYVPGTDTTTIKAYKYLQQVDAKIKV